MYQPRRSLRNIQPLPNIYTAFSVDHDSNSSAEHSGKCLIREIEDGIEVVPFERSNSYSAPILSPEQAEKEVLIVSEKEMGPANKPLPRLPTTLWGRLSMKQRILALLFIQAAILLTVGFILMAAGKHRKENDQQRRAQTTDDNPLQTDSAIPIARGTFSVPIPSPQQKSSSCLALSNESIAWQCASDTTFQLNVLPSPSSSNTTLITLNPPLNPNKTTSQGQQPPSLTPVKLTPINTTDNGPAFYFSTTYTRTVLLKDSAFAQPAMQQNPVFSPGETLWRCIFNETLLQGWIYLNETTTPTPTPTPSSTAVNATQPLPKTPHVMKIVEQRVPNGKQPYCEKVRLGVGGSLSRVDGGRRVGLSVVEQGVDGSNGNGDGGGNGGSRRSVVRGRRKVGRAVEDGYCRCQWMVQ